MFKPLNLLMLLLTLAVCLSAGQVYAWQTTADRVSLPSGSLIVLPDSRVEFVSETFAQAYWELAGRTRPTDLNAQVELFKWCIRNNLFEEASNHLLILQEMDLPAKTMMQLDVSLQISQKRHLESQRPSSPAPEAIASSPSQSNQAIIGLQSVDTIRIPNLHQTAEVANDKVITEEKLPVIDGFGNEVDPMVQQVSWEQPVTAVPTEAKPQSILPTVDAKLFQRLNSTESLTYSDLDRLTRSMPEGAVKLFHNQVEPLLQQACSQCHQSGATGHAFKVYQSRSGVIDRRMNQKNIYQSLNLSDRKQPGESLLLQYATVAHGGQTKASFQWQDSQLQAVKQWLVTVSEDPLLPVEDLSPPNGPEQTTPMSPQAIQTSLTQAS